MTLSINIYAGSTARKKIQAEGFQQQHFSVMAGASGGPKWFTLFGLDCYLFGEFFANRKQPLHTIGSSAGAWRMACFAQKDPVSAIQRLAYHYSNETYSSKPDSFEISEKAATMLEQLLGSNGVMEILNHQQIQSHFIVAKAKGFNRSDNRFVQMTGLLAAATANSISRQRLDNHFERFVFFTHNTQFEQNFFNFIDKPTQAIPLIEENIHPVLMASGAIPMVLRGIKDIPGAPAGIYRDGGIIDYHLDLNFNTEGLVLYPHFFPNIKPGWFDKFLKKRKADIKNFHNVVLITPSEQHVASLPYKKISDRKDFQTLDEKTRINYWNKVLDASHRMADDFSKVVNSDEAIKQVIPIEDILQN